MAFSLGAAVAGGAQTNFTSPTYTFSADTAPDVNGKQFAVTAIGGTQAGVTTHSATSPFSTTYWKPKTIRLLGAMVPNTGRLPKVPKNVHKVVTRKGVTVLAGQPTENLIITTMIEVPAGSDLADAANVKAAISAHIGALSNQSSGIGDTVLSNVM